MFATALALLASAFTGKDRGVAFGAFGATTGVAVAIGPVLGGVLTSGLSWRWIFFVNIPICVVALLVTVRRVQESHDPRAGTPDWAGFLSFSGALGLLVYGLIRAGEDGFGDAWVVACLVGAGFLLLVFLAVEVGARHPMFDLGLLRKPTFTGGLIAAFGVSASIFSLLTYLVIYVQNVLGYSAIETGLRFLFLSAASFFAAAAAGRLTERVPVRRRQRRQGRPGAVPDRSGAVSGERGERAGGAGSRAGQRNPGHGAGRRYKPLLEANAVSRQDYVSAVAAQKLAEAEIAAAKAACPDRPDQPRLRAVTSPISGRIGRALVTEGALVGQGEATQLAVMQQIDPMYVNFTQSTSEVMRAAPRSRAASSSVPRRAIRRACRSSWRTARLYASRASCSSPT